MDFERSLFVRGESWDLIPTVDSLNEHFTCKYMSKNLKAIYAKGLHAME